MGCVLVFGGGLEAARGWIWLVEHSVLDQQRLWLNEVSRYPELNTDSLPLHLTAIFPSGS